MKDMNRISIPDVSILPIATPIISKPPKINVYKLLFFISSFGVLIVIISFCFILNKLNKKNIPIEPTIVEITPTSTPSLNPTLIPTVTPTATSILINTPIPTPTLITISIPTPTTKPTPTAIPIITPTPIPANKISKIGKYINLIFDPDDVIKISDDKLTLWLSRLDLAYEYYFDLTSYQPYNGGKITIKSVECGDTCPGWAWAGQTISWAKKWWLIDELEKINNNDDWSFGILHEISHNFDFDNYGSNLGYNFDSESMANFKMAYLIESKNSKVSPGYSGVYYTGSQIINYYKLADKGYDYAIANNTYTGDFLTYVLLKTKDQIGGWDTYKQVFRNLKDKSFNSESARFSAFINEISSISKKDVKGIFSDTEKEILKTKFGNIF